MKKFIALLRGINISGKNKIAMSELKNVFEQNGYINVITYLNSGNVIFMSNEINKNIISKNIHDMIKNNFDIDIPIFIIEENELKELLDNEPDWWEIDNKEKYDNIIFIISPCTYETVYNTIGEPKKDLEKIQEYKNNIFWSYDLNNYRKTNWWSKTITTNVSDKITIRTKRTMKKILELCVER